MRCEPMVSIQIWRFFLDSAIWGCHGNEAIRAVDSDKNRAYQLTGRQADRAQGSCRGPHWGKVGFQAPSCVLHISEDKARFAICLRARRPSTAHIRVSSMLLEWFYVLRDPWYSEFGAKLQRSRVRSPAPRQPLHPHNQPGLSASAWRPGALKGCCKDAMMTDHVSARHSALGCGTTSSVRRTRMVGANCLFVPP